MWYCPACDPYFGERGGSKLQELIDQKPVLGYSGQDPYCDLVLIEYVNSGHSLDLLTHLTPDRAIAVRHKGSYIQKHPKIQGWLMI
jgi:hypothetical protein